MKLPNNTIIAEAKITQYLLKFLLEDDKSLFLAQANYSGSQQSDRTSKTPSLCWGAK
jgi:hypothetical protein